MEVIIARLKMIKLIQFLNKIYNVFSSSWSNLYKHMVEVVK